MLGRIIRDLTVSDLAFGGGPLLFAVIAFVNAARADGSYAQWSWIACAVVMLVLCAVYLTWTWRRREELREK